MSMTVEEARVRHIAAGDFAPCDEAFIDRRNPNSDGKLNYSFIGPGVAQSDKQVVNLREAHGFNVGGVSLPNRRINNLHLHFTAEVFIVTAGVWEFIWGNNGENSAVLHPGDLISIPTWIFRGFISRADDGFMFSVLGGDDTGGIIWNPAVLADAERAGMRLTAANRVIDEQNGERLPESESYMPPMPDDEMRRLRSFSPAQMERYIARWAALNWREEATPIAGLMATTVGAGMSAARHHHPPIPAANGFSVEWLLIPAGGDTGAWRVGVKQVFIVFEGAPSIIIGDGAVVADDYAKGAAAPPDAARVDLAHNSLYSAPANTWRRLVNPGGGNGYNGQCIAIVITEGDARPRPQWSDDALAFARTRGLCFDADARLSPIAALPPPAAPRQQP